MYFRKKVFCSMVSETWALLIHFERPISFQKKGDLFQKGAHLPLVYKSAPKFPPPPPSSADLGRRGAKEPHWSQKDHRKQFHGNYIQANLGQKDYRYGTSRYRPKLKFHGDYNYFRQKRIRKRLYRSMHDGAE